MGKNGFGKYIIYECSACGQAVIMLRKDPSLEGKRCTSGPCEGFMIVSDKKPDPEMIKRQDAKEET